MIAQEDFRSGRQGDVRQRALFQHATTAGIVRHGDLIRAWWQGQARQVKRARQETPAAGIGLLCHHAGHIGQYTYESASRVAFGAAAYTFFETTGGGVFRGSARQGLGANAAEAILQIFAGIRPARLGKARAGGAEQMKIGDTTSNSALSI